MTDIEELEKRVRYDRDLLNEMIRQSMSGPGVDGFTKQKIEYLNIGSCAK